MPVLGLKGTGLPVIKLYTGATPTYTITLSDWLYTLEVLDPQWTEEFDTEDTRMADSSRTEKEYSAGYRFSLAMEFEDKQLNSDPTSTEKREYFEWLMDQLRCWRQQGATYTIRVYPFEDNTAIYYDCRVTEGAKSNTNYRGIPVTAAHRHRIVLRAIQLTATIPQQSPLPWGGTPSVAAPVITICDVETLFGGKGLVLAWTLVTTNVTGIKVYIATANVKPADPSVVLGPTVTGYAVPVGAGAAHYYVWVVAYNEPFGIETEDTADYNYVP